MTDLFDRLLAKAGGGAGALTPVPPPVPRPVWGPGLVEDVQTVPTGPAVQRASVVPPQVTALAPHVKMPTPALVPVPVLQNAAPTVKGTPRAAVHDLADAPEHRTVASPAPALRPVAKPAAPPHLQRADRVATLTPLASQRPVSKPVAPLAVPSVGLAPPATPPLSRLRPAAVQHPAFAAARTAATPPPHQAPAPPDIRITIGHIRVTAPPPAPIAAAVTPRPVAPKGQALKAYLGWRR